jgi:DNA-binding LacI/PurR family transcriptional regulator
VTKTTLEQLAEKAQVSTSTVSRVLNGKKGVNEGTRRRVLSILRGADYGTGNGLAATRTNRTIGVLVPAAAQHWGLHSNFIREGLQAVTDIGRQSNYITMVGAFSPDLGDRAEDRMILDREFAGVLLFRTRDEEQDSKPFRDHNIPYIVVNRLLPGTAIHYVGVDHCEVSRQATTYLLRNGYRRIGILLGDTHYISHQLYSRGYEEAHTEAGVIVDPSLMATIELNAEEGYAGTHRLMKQRKQPDALIVPSDRSAIGALKAMRDLHIKIPAHVGLLSLDGTNETVFANPPLTAVEMPWYEMLALGTTLLIRMVEDRPPIEQIGIRFASRLVVRESTRARA